MEPKSLPSEDAQIQRRAQGSVPSMLLGMAETINTSSPFPDFPNPFTLPFRAWSFSLKGFSPRPPPLMKNRGIY